jgi:hypothetical protein
MLTLQELATVRAALLHWQEEMCPHPAAMIAALRERFQASAVRHFVLSLASGERLLTTAEAALQLAGDREAVATVIF